MPHDSNKIKYLVGSADIVEQMTKLSGVKPFSEMMTDFLDSVSKKIMRDSRCRAYSDVVTFAFWIRRASVSKLRERFEIKDKRDSVRFGRGVAFHIAPSNVPVNFAYSLVVGLLTGNANIVRIPSRYYEQVDIIVDAFNSALENMPSVKPYIVMVQYERDREVNDLFSAVSDTRIIWGGDATIEEIRKSPLPPRSTEITFADRYSIALIDSDEYINIKDKRTIAIDFYNDTYFSDQNACTSPRIVIWIGQSKEVAKKQFWEELHTLVMERYSFQAIQGISKLTSSCLIATSEQGVKIAEHPDNLIIRISVPDVSAELMELKDNSGYFFEYDCDDVLDLKPLCDDKHCQTIGILGDTECLMPLIMSGIKGVDRIVPIGRTMDFDLIWDGYDLVSSLTRDIIIKGM